MRQTTCVTCLHDQREEIEARLEKGEAAYLIAPDYGISKNAIYGHRKNHMGMSQTKPCPVCTSPDRHAIEMAMVEDTPTAQLSAKYKMNVRKLIQHSSEHMHLALLRSTKVEEIANSDELVDRLTQLDKIMSHSMAQLIKSGKNQRDLTAAVGQAAKLWELRAKLAGRISGGGTSVTVNNTAVLLADSGAMEFINRLYDALGEYPGARQVVVSLASEMSRERIAAPANVVDAAASNGHRR